MKLRETILTGICIAVVGCARVSDDQVSDALDGVFFPETDRQTAGQALSTLGDGPPEIPMLQSQLGTNNLSYFLLTLKVDTPLIQSGEYDFTWDTPDVEVMAEQFSRTGSFVTSEDVTNLTYSTVGPHTVEGSFQLKTDFDLKAHLLFRARSQRGRLRVTRLAAKHMDSENVDDGFQIVAR